MATDVNQGIDTLGLETELDRLEQETSKMLALLRDRHVGLSTWRFLVGQRALAIQQSFKTLGMVKE